MIEKARSAAPRPASRNLIATAIEVNARGFVIFAAGGRWGHETVRMFAATATLVAAPAGRSVPRPPLLNELLAPLGYRDVDDDLQ